jgi:ubiquinone/menaquinone biosynthesis C-methylase UbiE
MGRHEPRAAEELYRRVAGGYDLATAWLEPYRERAIARLGLCRDQVVLDVGCGTGASFAAIEAAVGPGGRLVGVEPSAEMLARARQRVRALGWRNVTLVEATAEEAALPAVQADAVLFAFTHDVLRSRAALVNVLGHLRPAGQVVAVGPMWTPLPPLNLLVWQVARHFVTTFEGFWRPWTELARLVPGLAVEEACYGCIYLASGRAPGRPPATPDR